MISYIFLQILHLICVPGILVSAGIHVWSYYHTELGEWIFISLFLIPALTVHGLIGILAQTSEGVKHLPLGFNETLRHLPLWKKIGISVGVFSGILISALLSYITPSAQLTEKTLSAGAIALYSSFLAGVYWMKFRVLHMQLSSPAFSERVEAMFMLAKLQDPSVIPLLADALSEADSVQQDRLVNACAYVGDSRTLFPLFNLLSEAPHYRQRQFHSAIDRACKSIHTLCFGGVAPECFEPHSSVANLDFTRVRFRLSHLRHIHIDPTSANFFHLEHFLTYAVNKIGQRYLKRHVEHSRLRRQSGRSQTILPFSMTVSACRFFSECYHSPCRVPCQE